MKTFSRILGLLSICIVVGSSQAQPVPATTAFTRNWLRSTNIATALANAGMPMWYSWNGVSSQNVQNLLSDLSKQNTNDTFLLGPGVWDIGTNLIYLTNGVTLRGSGKYSTVLKSGATGAAGEIIGYSDNDTIRDLTILGSLTDGTLQSPLGPAFNYVMLGSTNFILNVNVFAYSDGWVLGASQGGTNTLVIRGLSITTYWDTFRVLSTSVASSFTFDVDGFDFTRLAGGGSIFSSGNDLSGGLRTDGSVAILTNNWRNGTITLFCGTNAITPIATGRATNNFANIILNIVTNAAGPNFTVFAAGTSSVTTATNITRIDGGNWSDTHVSGSYATNNVGTNTLSGTALLAVQQREIGLLNAGSPQNSRGLFTLTVGSSPFAWTNTQSTAVQVYSGGGTVSAVALNGSTLPMTAGLFVLEPGEWLTWTHTGAPTAAWKVTR